MATARTPVWAGIVRVSHVGSRNGDAFHADEDQVADVERYARAHGAKVVFMEPELSVSGGAPIEQRPALVRAIEGCEAGEFDGIVSANLKRLSRSRSGHQIWERVEAAGGHVHCAAESVDTSTPNGRFVRDIFLAEAVREREEHVQRNADRRRSTVEAGIWRQRQLPLDYRFRGPAVDGRFKNVARRLVPSTPPVSAGRSATRRPACRSSGSPTGWGCPRTASASCCETGSTWASCATATTSTSAPTSRS